MASSFDNSLAPSTCDQCDNPAEDTVRCSVRVSKYLCRCCFRDLPSREDIGEQEWVCVKHATQKVDFFCERCEIGCCKECAIKVHKDHKVVDVVKFVLKFKQELLAQLEEVNATAEVLSELRHKVNDTMNKIKEAPMVVEKVVREIKEEVQRNLDEEIHRIKVEAQLSIMEKEKQRDQKLKLAKEKADRDIQRIIAIQRDINTDPIMLGKVAEWSNKMEKSESILLVKEQACKRANLKMESMLQASPEKVICGGRYQSNFVKTLSASFKNDQMVISASRKEVEADIPECQVNIEDFFSRPCRVYKWFVLFMAIILLFASTTKYKLRYERNEIMLSYESLSSLVWSCLSIPVYDFAKCVSLSIILAPFNSDYPVKIKIRTLKVCGVMLHMVLECWLLTTFLLFIVSSFFYLFQVKNVDEVFVIPFLLIYLSKFLPSFQTFISYMKVNKHIHASMNMMICLILVLAHEYARFNRPFRRTIRVHVRDNVEWGITQTDWHDWHPL